MKLDSHRARVFFLGRENMVVQNVARVQLDRVKAVCSRLGLVGQETAEETIK